MPLFPHLEWDQQVDTPFPDSNNPYSGRDIGTFKDSMRAPIHRWFRYPAGYSYKFVFENFDLFNIKPGDWVYDPFSGTGTTLICAKQKGINAYGVEAHSFVHWIASVKLYWDFDLTLFERQLDEVLVQCRNAVFRQVDHVEIEGVFPALIYKCYHPHDLKELYVVREFIMNEIQDRHVQDFLKLALTDTLRSASSAGTGWPYIAPRKHKKPIRKGAFAVFEKFVRQMFADLYTVISAAPGGEIHNVLGDSRNRQNLEDNQVKLSLTSPPYLNNYDYADRTRLETYFWGITQTWKDITTRFRDKLIVAATTQITRSHYQVETTLTQEIAQISPEIYRTLQQSILQLAEIRTSKGGKKDYDLMVALYFNDMLRVLQETYRVLDNGGHACLVLGDSAPYGVHIETDRLIGKLALGIGFSSFDYHELRQRGGKWKDNPQRHRVPLREGVVILTK
jgi:DNA modification methylase